MYILWLKAYHTFHERFLNDFIVRREINSKYTRNSKVTLSFIVVVKIIIRYAYYIY
jgi:hypothetical protein